MTTITKTRDHLICSISIDMADCERITREPMRRYAERINADFYVLDHSDKSIQSAKFDLLTMAHRIGYSKILYLDIDVHIRRGVPNILEHYTNALYNESPAIGQWLSDEQSAMITSYQKMIPTHNLGDPYYNTGVMVLDAAGLGALCLHMSTIDQNSANSPHNDQHRFNELLHVSDIVIHNLNERWNTNATGLDVQDPRLIESYFVHIPGTPKKHKAAKLKAISEYLL